MRGVAVRRIGRAMVRWSTGLWLAASMLGGASAAPFDRARIETIPTIDVIRLATTRFHIIVYVDDAQKAGILKEIAALDPKVQTLVWLALLDDDLNVSTERDGSRPLGYTTSGYFLTQTKAALADAGLKDRAAVFATATAGVKERRVDPSRKPPTSWAEVDEPRDVPIPGAFGGKPAFVDAMLAYVRATPAAAAWCAAQRAGLSDDDRLTALFTSLDRIDGSWTLAVMADWPEPYRVLNLVEIYNGEMLNGGVHQYFANSSGDLAPATVAALRKIGLPKQAEVIEKGMGFFETPYPTDRRRRSRAFDHEGFNDWDTRLNALTGAADDGTMRPAMIAFAKRQGVLPR